ncbi:MAG: PRC-barrel domain-containing protein [Chloroflexia bacterium]|nr:PRC-barrel domain-containing protein [Chloroflexia bacterium]
MSTRLVKGTSVVSLADGTELGSVEHVYLDPARKLIVAFSFQSGGGLFGSKARSVVDVTDVHAIGPDAITITDASAIRSEMAIGDRCHGLIELDDLLKRKVMTERGEHLGQLTAIHFEQGSYRVSMIEVSHGRLHPETTTIPAEQIGQIGDDLILVSDPAAIPAEDRNPAQVSSRRTALRSVA